MPEQEPSPPPTSRLSPRRRSRPSRVGGQGRHLESVRHHHGGHRHWSPRLHLHACPHHLESHSEHGPTTGGTAITITGTGFVSGATVVVGQGNGAGTGAIAATNVKVVSSTQITAVTGGGPRPAPGACSSPRRGAPALVTRTSPTTPSPPSRKSPRTRADDGGNRHHHHRDRLRRRRHRGDRSGHGPEQEPSPPPTSRLSPRRRSRPSRVGGPRPAPGPVRHHDGGHRHWLPRLHLPLNPCWLGRVEHQQLARWRAGPLRQQRTGQNSCDLGNRPCPERDSNPHALSDSGF